jgi:hypothetical protein
MKTITADDFPQTPSLVLMVDPAGRPATVSQPDVMQRIADGWHVAQVGEEVQS